VGLEGLEELEELEVLEVLEGGARLEETVMTAEKAA
jgi:hypothetical protein